jgi:riboflavin synthase
MFTGLIQEVGKVAAATRLRGNLRLAIEAKNVSSGIATGSSISVNGACLTVVKTGSRFEVEAGRETLSRTNLSGLKPGSKVNLESPVTPTSAFGGHFVTGHVDATARIKSIKPEGGSEVWEMETPGTLAKYLVEKGSVCLDGVSLTVASVKRGSFTVFLMPHTLGATTFRDKRRGDLLNIETDILAKHVEKLVHSRGEEE